jgi:16S rRNA (guanine527-N7)-methyltransferase
MTRIDTPEAFESAFQVSRETIARLETYERLLRQWQKVVNLVAPATLDETWHRHFADSAQLAALIPAGTRSLVDLGSGAGFPGLVLAILLAERQTGPKVTLIESDARKAAFLREVARSIVIAVDILVTRIENPETQLKLATADVVTARALAPLPKLLGWLAPAVRPECTALLLKGREADAEVAAAVAQFSFSRRLVPSRTQPEARIVIVTALGRKPED